MKSAFLPYLPAFLPELYMRLRKQPAEMSMDGNQNVAELLGTDDIAAQKMELSLTMKVDPTTGEQKMLLIKTAYIEDIESALHVGGGSFYVVMDWEV